MDSYTLSLVSTLLFVFFAAFSGGILAYLLRLPMFLGYIAMGVVVGTFVSPFLNTSFLTSIADVGVTLLLFTLGLEFSFRRLRSVIGVVSWAAIVQILATTFLIFTLLLLIGFGVLPALFIGVAASLSSTAIVVKLLGERGELETIPGEVLTGWLVIQDLSVIPIMMLLPAISQSFLSGSATAISTASIIGINILKSCVAIVVVLFFGKVGIPVILRKVAEFRNKELFLVATVGFVFFSALLTYAFGLSAALGAFLAGLLVAETSEHYAVFSEIRPLRDVFAVVFFVSLGMTLPLGSLFASWQILLLLLLVLFVGKFLLVFFLSRFLGYHRKTSFLVGLGLIQVSEFGFIIAKEGLRLGALSQDEYTLLIALVIMAIFGSIPLMSNGNTMYYRLMDAFGGKLKSWFPSRRKENTEYDVPMENHIIICGYGRVGKYIGRALQMANIPFVVIDYNHATIEKLRQKGIEVVYGDPADMHVLEVGQVKKAQALIIAIPDRQTQELIIGNALTLNRGLRVICRTHHEEDQLALKTLGATTVVQPEFEAALSIINKVLPEYGVRGEELSGKIHRLKIEHGVG